MRIAEVAHESYRAWSAANGDASKPRWEEAPEPQRQFAINGVQRILNGASPADLHESWRGYKAANGWTYGGVKNQRTKTTPNLVPYAQLSSVAKHKNDLFASVTRSLSCGYERWDVKTLTDAMASQVQLVPQASTISELIGLSRPGGLGAALTSRIAQEFYTYQLTGTIVLAKLESDTDIHMVLQDDAGNTMIIEAVSPSCCQDSSVASQIAAVRQAVEAQFPTAAAGGREEPAGGILVTVTGVAFFDRPHGQEGLAPNAIELHPVLTFQPPLPANAAG